MPMHIRTPKFQGASVPYPAYLNLLDRKATAVQRALRRGGLAQYEPEFQAALFALCEGYSDQLVFYDVGAHIGLYSALLETLFQARCLAFEPTPDTAAMCELMRRTNNLKFDIIQKGVSAADGRTTFYLSPKAETSNSLNAEFRPGAQSITVPIVSIDSLTRSGAPDPQIVKIDVETHEPEVIRGALETIDRARPIIACEFLTQIDRSSLRHALSPLFELGYAAYHVQSQRPFEPYNLEQLLTRISSKESDWLITPRPLDSRFDVAFQRWQAALSKCDASTNIFSEGGSPSPESTTMLWPAAG